MVAKQFFNGTNMNDIGKISHVLKHSHRRCAFSAFDKFLHEGYTWAGPRAVIYFILQKSIFLHFVHHGTKCYDKHITTDDRTNLLMMMGVIFFKNRMIEIFIIQNIRRQMETDDMFFPHYI